MIKFNRKSKVYMTSSVNGTMMLLVLEQPHLALLTMRDQWQHLTQIRTNSTEHLCQDPGFQAEASTATQAEVPKGMASVWIMCCWRLLRIMESQNRKKRRLNISTALLLRSTSVQHIPKSGRCRPFLSEISIGILMQQIKRTMSLQTMAKITDALRRKRLYSRATLRPSLRKILQWRAQSSIGKVLRSMID